MKRLQIPFDEFNDSSASDQLKLTIYEKLIDLRTAVYNGRRSLRHIDPNSMKAMFLESSLDEGDAMIEELKRELRPVVIVDNSGR